MFQVFSPRAWRRQRVPVRSANTYRRAYMARNGQPRLRPTRLKLTNWRNFQAAEVRLAKRAFFIGPNAAGKSNLLDAVRFLRDLVKPIAGGFGTALELRNGLSGVRCLQARRVSYVEIDTDVGNEDNSAVWSYRIRFNRFGHESFPTVEEEAIEHNGKHVEGQHRTKSEADPFLFSQSVIQQAT